MKTFVLCGNSYLRVDDITAFFPGLVPTETRILFSNGEVIDIVCTPAELNALFEKANQA